ncbi:hypothetical protein PG593_03660 [Riemerella anatipestifer]|uniref:hypothetical protein n=1 Tax=Riemerella anatipestifer TaxID=34085 RepID=UPI00069C3753|nr:hypothetical protein [Riemerella anatipestifer]MDR7694121.1 hypothetical protein [Riemerella anatipestifer]MDY3528876.1 hypothetical protein [Riemerella anatipestifer]MDY3538091.1 hypothetical protein [Riemerella anatipestifer]
MSEEEIRELSIEIRSQKILLGITAFAVVYLIYYGVTNPKWIYYSSISGAYLLTKVMSRVIKLYRNIKKLKKL